MFPNNGAITQLVEFLTDIQAVVGSSPTSTTKQFFHKLTKKLAVIHTVLYVKASSFKIRPVNRLVIEYNMYLR